VRVLLDECVPRKLGALLSGHEVLTVPRAGLAGITNGKLLAQAEESFEAFITLDHKMLFQQNLSAVLLKIIVVRATTNRLEDIKIHIPAILGALETMLAGEIMVID
jgi:hypothetical protein